ncbi:MAG: hypothetical protein CME70_04485 [Halobacteriovorax sp.]|nr:hypothetical protein [Halobacteriovorax sp.]|tara:strand:+ start:11128 stop:11826 length:699 start_codon:yes stop_codon:yes gene_type:complete
MKVKFVPYGVYLDILSAVGRWKVLDYSGISEFCGHDLKYKNLASKVKKLENAELLKSIFAEKKKKYLFLSHMGSQLVPKGSPYDVENASLHHDILVVRILRYLTNFESFHAPEIISKEVLGGVEPDAVIQGMKNDKKYSMAIEVELTQKSEKRVKEKLSKYGQDRSSLYCLYITQKKSLYRTYKRFLEEMDTMVQAKVFLLLDEGLIGSEINFTGKQVFFKGETKTFEEIFL